VNKLVDLLDDSLLYHVLKVDPPYQLGEVEGDTVGIESMVKQDETETGSRRAMKGRSRSLGQF
jgi:hypothetical protein